MKTQDNTQTNFCRVQDLFNCALSDFINGDSLVTASKILFPIIDKHRNHFMDFAVLLKNMNCRDFQQSLCMINKISSQKTISTNAFADTLCTLYSDLLPHLKQHTKYTKGATIKSVKIKSNMAKDDWLKAIKQRRLHKLEKIIAHFNENLSIFSKSFLVHGSYATLDYIPHWSDLDTFLAIKDDVCLNKEKLISLRTKVLDFRKLLCTIDGLQHHGVFFITESSFDFYPQNILPFKVIQNSVFLTELPRITERDSCTERKNAFMDLASYFENLKLNDVKSLYELKILYHAFFLLPCIYFQVKGRYFYKKDVFEPITKEFPEYAKLFDEMSKIRSSWPYKSYLPKFLTKPLLGLHSHFTLSIITRLFLLISKKKLLVDLPNQLKQTKNLVVEMKYKMRKGGFI